jgi:hemerythrin superfamily protein
MPSTTRSRSTSQAASTARSQVLKQLKDDHGRVKKAYREFEKFDPVEGAEYCEAIVQQVLRELTVHAALEEELLYPAARGAIADEALIDEAEVEHETVRTFIEQLRNMDPEENKYGASFTVLCEYVLHYVKEEEGEIFPQLERTRLDWESLAAEMDQRRQQLVVAEKAEAGDRSARGAEAGAEDDIAVAQRRATESRRNSDARCN